MDSYKSNLSLYSLYYAEACNEFARPIFASMGADSTTCFEEMSQRWRTVGDTVFDLTGPRFEPYTSRSRDERVTARPTVWSFLLLTYVLQYVQTNLAQHNFFVIILLIYFFQYFIDYELIKYYSI